jgi:hypothetical protein
MERSTGATDAQVEEAFILLAGLDHDSDAYVLDDLRHYAKFLVPPTRRIVSVEDLEALLDAAGGAVDADAYWGAAGDRIRALIGDRS